MNALGDTLAGVKAKTYGNTRGDELAEAQVDTFSDTIAKIKAKTVGETL